MTTATANEIPVKQAIKTAIQFVKTTYDETGTLIADLALEEVQPTDDGELWHITVGFFRSRDPQIDLTFSTIPNPLSSRFDKTRQYKVVQVNRRTGEVRAMTIREIQGA